jgi:hypothetical protein
MKPLLTPDAGDGGGAAPPADLTPANAAPTLAAPPAAKIVVEGPKSEREIELEDELTRIRADLDQTKSAHAATVEIKKLREVRISELEDERKRLSTPATPRPRKPEIARWGFRARED